MNKRKKVVLLIVEGESEEILLYDYLRDHFSKYNILIEQQRGDIFFDIKKRGAFIKNVVGDRVREFMSRRKFRMEDMLAVLHIADTDGCLISGDRVILNELQEIPTLYESESISVQTENQRNFIRERNAERARNIKTMNTVQMIMGGKLPYQMYYFSRHLEHVLFDNPNPSAQGKPKNVEDFLSNLTMDLEKFLLQFMPVLNGETDSEMYQDSWKQIELGINSLQRATNVPLLFKYITNRMIEP